jgi:NADH-quinone oxidoreductase subunit G
VHHNEGRVYRIKPRYNAGLNKWWISDEIRYGWKFVHSEDRLSKPMRQQLGTQVDTEWSKAYEDARDGIRKAVAEGGTGTLAVMVSPMLSSEEAYLLGKLARGIDAKAILAVGPVPTDGQDKTFKGGYTVYAEKAPNARGVRRALELVAGDAEQVIDFNTLVAQLADKASKIGAVILTGNYPSAWTTKEFAGSLRKPFVVLIDTLPTDISAKANVLLPGATWLEKAGSFENVNNVMQAFEQAIPVMELCKPEGQIALDLAAVFGLCDRAVYNPEYIREEMGGVYTTDVKFPSLAAEPEPDLEYVEL